MKTEWIRFALEELSHIKRIRDVLNLEFRYQFLISRISRMLGKPREYLLGLQIEPTNACNIACTCCSRKSLTRDIGYMDLGLFRKIIDDAACNSIRMVYLYLHGEPFLHPEIMEMLAYIKTKKLAVVITTNGMLLNRDMALQLLGCGLTNADHLVFSVLGHTKQTHEQIMNGVRHEEVVRNIEGIIDSRQMLRASGPIIEAAIYQMPENSHEIGEFVSRWRGVVDHVREPAAISEQFAGTGTCKNRNTPCKNLQERLTIFWNGDVCLCHADLNGRHNFGNMATTGIREVWDSQEMLRIRQKHRNRDFAGLPLCLECDWE